MVIWHQIIVEPSTGGCNLYYKPLEVMAVAKQALMGGRGVALPILSLGARRGCVVNAMPQPLCPQGKRCGTHYIAGCVQPWGWS